MSASFVLYLFKSYSGFQPRTRANFKLLRTYSDFHQGETLLSRLREHKRNLYTVCPLE